MICVVVDIDDTLVITDQRMQSIWQKILDPRIPLKAVETMSLEQIFMKYASPEQKTRIGDFQKRFWDIVLCQEEVGIELLKLHKPIPHAADILQQWKKQAKLIYLTGRTENTRQLTLTELKHFNFPTINTELHMFKPQDYERARGTNPKGATLVEAKSQLLKKITERDHVVRAIDDYPGYFTIYKQHNIPDRIGLQRQKRYPQEAYLEQGATRVIKSWKELENDPPKPA